MKILLSGIIFLLLFPGGVQAGKKHEHELAHKIGQMLMVGFRGLEVERDSPVVRDIKEGRVGGVILFDYDVALQRPVRNIESPEQLQRLIKDLQTAGDGRLLVAVDQEGGRVARLKEKHGFPETVSQAWLGEQDDPELTHAHASKTAATLDRMGININLAPVVDVNVNPENPVIGGLKRSFSFDPDIVARHAREVILAHREQGVLTALKHFPGHGSSTEDSHLGFTDVTRTWSSSELKPYRDLFKSPGADMVMTAHVFNARLDPEWPATLSSRVLNGLLRKDLGFDGVIISDDMQMKAITDNHHLETALKKTILAGTDIIIFGNNLVYEEDVARKAGDIILDLVRRDKIPAARIKEAHQRIMNLKEQIADRPAK
ncbi:glycoside hydrolase family 3 protein [Desulfonatronospira sp.]|uniref:glycoside hydrolase family 3 protein n=1 Tax=Desulfonatronospira sp. TaxID=1962951 RepID=UPI0025BF085A|nr:glycoside hydrolase family 3 protein [Desulfonatronospira sp.]